MVTLRRIGVRSAARTGFWFGVAMGLVQLIIAIILIMVLSGRLPDELFSRQFLVRLIIGLLVGGFNTALVAALFSFVYNIAAGPSGGLKLVFDSADTPATKRKNGQTEADS